MFGKKRHPTEQRYISLNPWGGKKGLRYDNVTSRAKERVANNRQTAADRKTAAKLMRNAESIKNDKKRESAIRQAQEWADEHGV